MPKTPTSPKLFSGVVWATIATLLPNALTPELIASLGKWGPLVSAAVAILSFAAGVYLREDPLRTAGANAANAEPNAAAAAPVTDPGVVVAEIANRLAKPADTTN